MQYYLLAPNATTRTYVYATADFVDKNTGEVQKPDTNRRIYRLSDGRFVFEWKVRSKSKTWYVLTSNDGHYLSDGRDGIYSYNGEKPENWKEKDSTPYTISNFQGIDI